MTGSQPEPEDDGDDDGSPLPPEEALVGGYVLHLFAAAIAVATIVWRDRSDALWPRALGDVSPWLAGGVGLAAGVALAWTFAALHRWLPGLTALEGDLRHMFTGCSDAALAVFFVAGALAEELLFRLALPDWIGAPAAVAAAALVNSWAVGKAWLLPGLAHAALFCLMLDQGLGLLATATAGAVANYLMIRRILCRSEA